MKASRGGIFCFLLETKATFLLYSMTSPCDHAARDAATRQHVQLNSDHIYV